MKIKDVVRNQWYFDSSRSYLANVTPFIPGKNVNADDVITTEDTHFTPSNYSRDESGKFDGEQVISSSDGWWVVLRSHTLPDAAYVRGSSNDYVHWSTGGNS